MTEPLDFTGKRILVIGGSSGIGNGIAHGFRARGAAVTVTGARPDYGDYLEAEDADFTGLDYRQLSPDLHRDARRAWRRIWARSMC